jgi:hypothetical protein
MPVFRGLFACLAALTLAETASAQSVREHEVGSRAFAFHGSGPRKITSYEAGADARQIVVTIMSKVGLPMNLDVRAAPGIRNAEALVEEVSGKQARVILYDPKWMEDLKSTLETNWSDIGILAHEIGHHLANHTDPAYADHPAELEADFFSGFILNRMGASLEQAQLPMAVIASDSASLSHPARVQRVQEIGRGWKSAAAGQSANVIKSATAAGPRVALLIGNSDYRSLEKLRNPKSDVIHVRRELNKHGFSTTVLYDGTKDQIAEAVSLFRDEAKGADWALFYFAGNGFEVNGVNYMVPVDAVIDPARRQLDATLLRLDTVFEAVKEAKTLRLVVADACRDDPFSSAPSSLASRAHHFKVTEPPPGIVVAYSTRSGETALDGDGVLSPYAQSLIKALQAPGIEIDKVFRRVGADVAEATQGKQRPIVMGDWPAQDLYLARK